MDLHQKFQVPKMPESCTLYSKAIFGVGFPFRPYPYIPEMFGEICSKPRARSWMFSSIASDVLRSPGVRFDDGG